MAASVSGSTITFTGSNANPSDMTGLSGVSTYGSATGKTIYRLSSRQIKFASGASLIVDPDFEEIIFEANCPSPEIDYSGGTLQIGRKRTANGKTRYSSGTAITITRQSDRDAQTNTIGGIIQDGNGGSFIGYGGWIHTASPISFCGKLNGNRDGSVLIETLGIFGRLVGDGTAPQVRFDNTAGQSVNVSGLVLDCDPNILDNKRSIVLFSQDFTTFSAIFKSFSFQSFTSQPFGLRLDNLAFNENFRPSDLVANGGGETFVIANSDKGSGANIAIQTNSACHFGFYGTANIVTLDENGDPLGDCNYYIADENRGGRFAPIGNTSLIFSLMGVYGSAGNNIYNGRTNGGTGEASETILLSTWRTDGSGGFDHEDYSNGGGLADVMDVVTYKYGYLPAVLSPQFREEDGPDVKFESKVNISITQQDKSTVDGYTTLDNANELYDRSAADLDDLYAGERVLTLGIEGSTILGGSKNFIINSSGAAYNLSGNTLTFRSNNYSSGISTTGTVTLQGSSVVSNGTFTCNVITQSGKTFTDVTIPSGNVLQVTSGGTITLDASDIGTVQNTSGQQVNVVLINGSSIPNVTGGNITIINDMTVNINNLQIGDSIKVTDNNAVQQIFTQATSSNFQFNVTRDNDGEQWRVVVDRVGFSPSVANFIVAEGTNQNITATLSEYLRAAGAVMYQGSTTPLVDVSFDLNAPQATITLNGTATPQQIFDEFEQALVTADGMSWHLEQGSIVTQDDIPGVGPILFMQGNIRLFTTNLNGGVAGYVLSTDGVPVDTSSNPIGFVGGLSQESLAGAVWDALLADHNLANTFGNFVQNISGGGGGGVADWTAAEKEQIRSALGVNGTKTTATGGQLQNKLDASGYTAPDNAGIAAIPTNTLLANDSRLNRLDVNVSTRMATFTYTAPDNTAISNILADTNELQQNQGNWLTATGFSTFNASTDEVTTDNASRVASRATGFATPSDVNSTQSAIISAIGNLNNLSAAQVTAAVPSTAQIEAALINEGDGQQLIDAIVTLINSNLDLPALELAAIASQVRVELSTELSRIDRNLSTLSTFDPSSTLEGSTTYDEALRVMLAESSGKVNINGNTVTFRDTADTKDRITATVDQSGQRTNVIIDGS